jgi:hypothetical protein
LLVFYQKSSSFPQYPDKRGTPVEETGNKRRELLLPAVCSLQKSPPALKGLADMLAMARVQEDLLGGEKTLCGGIFPGHLHLVLSLVDIRPGSPFGKMFFPELVGIDPVPEGRSRVPANRRKFPDKQLEEEHAPLLLHIVVRMMDSETVALKEFMHR